MTQIYTFTLYTKDYKINLGKTTYIYNDTNRNETIEDKSDHMNLNIYYRVFEINSSRNGR